MTATGSRTALVTLDGICSLWECEHEAVVAAWMPSSPVPVTWDISDPCDSLTVPGVSSNYNVKDVVFESVAINLEVISSSLLTSDCCENHRTDGSRTGIGTYYADDDHGGVHRAGSDSMSWVTDQIQILEALR